MTTYSLFVIVVDLGGYRHLANDEVFERKADAEEKRAEVITTMDEEYFGDIDLAEERIFVWTLAELMEDYSDQLD